jgi:hypothetical protein
LLEISTSVKTLAHHFPFDGHNELSERIEATKAANQILRYKKETGGQL